ncbi:hypothetical protein [Afipia clevelandensis]|uniref:Integrase catalytic domain-containing protein n=1 Tax=Afipia clevelandensis ATCC 49720 TaxID=883079 RepID=K8P0H8_9BRAD|nr:hypothetical protein [Afipia clevelandensis]EKS31948.1 hypothetical protein HMPREF9696_04169 [Afipia clevelandensis ATCC 49720]
MQPNLQHADPSADPHDAIAAQLRGLAPRVMEESAQLSIAPAVSPELAREPEFQTAPLNDNIGDLLDSPHLARSRRRLFMTTVCAGMLIAAVWLVYGDTAKQQISQLIPQLRPAALVPQTASVESQDSAGQASPSEPKAEAATAPNASTRDANTAPSVPEATSVPGQAQLPPEIAQSIESMKQEIASLRQTVEQLQTGQQQLGRDVAKINEQEARRAASAKGTKPAPKRQAQPQRALAAPVVIPRPAAPYPPSQTQAYPHAPAQRDTYAAPAAPAQLPPQPGDASVPRPPMPLR